MKTHENYTSLDKQRISEATIIQNSQSVFVEPWEKQKEDKKGNTMQRHIITLEGSEGLSRKSAG